MGVVLATLQIVLRISLEEVEESMTRKRRRTERQETSDQFTYKGLTGKIVEFVDSYSEDDNVHIGIRFEDQTELVFVIAAQPPKITNAELLRWKDGEMSVARRYTRAKT